MNPFVIILIETKSKYSGLKGNQGTVIGNGSLWKFAIDVKLSCVWLENWYL